MQKSEQEGGGPVAAAIRTAPWTALALALIAAGVGGFVLLQIFRPQPAASPPAAGATLVRAQPIEHRQGPLPISGEGFVRPRAEVRLTAEVGAKVAEVSPRLVGGGTFRKDDLLVRLDPRRFEAAIARARADLKAQAAQLDFAEKQLSRGARLKSRGFASAERLDELQSRKLQAAAAIESLKARIAELELDLENTRITAPFDGTVRSESVEPGDVVRPGTEIARIFATDRYEITVALDDSDAMLIPGLWQEGGANAPARVFTTYGGTRHSWRARVARAERALDDQARTVNVVVSIPRPETPDGAGGPPLLVGSFARAVIDGLDPGPQALVPRSALHDGNTAYVIAPDGTLAIVPVEIVYEDGDTAFVRAGALASYERIIVSALKPAIEGMAVREPGEAPGDGGSGKP